MKAFQLAVVCLGFLLQSCCQNYNSTVGDGFPYSGPSQQVAVKSYTGSILKNPAFIALEDSLSLHGKLIRDTAECNAYFRQFNPFYSCDIDFSKYSLTVAKGTLEYTYTEEMDPKIGARFMVNHKNKTCTLEIRGKSRICNGWGYKNDFLILRDFILVPKIPTSYNYHVVKFWPVY